ncbi:MAG: hypothetical protein JXN64_13130 [Spirochaetes bacterium]|nr:hypothetical protein [Spirochaetota bacterium]
MAEEQTIKTEGQTSDGAVQGEQKSQKKKKINKLSLDDINKKLDILVQASQIKSKYYQHLVQRKNELQVQA